MNGEITEEQKKQWQAKFEAKKEQIRQELTTEFESKQKGKTSEKMEKIISKEIKRLRKKAKKEGIETTPEIEQYWEDEAELFVRRCWQEALEDIDYKAARIAKKEIEREMLKEAHPIASKLGYIASGAWFFGK